MLKIRILTREVEDRILTHYVEERILTRYEKLVFSLHSLVRRSHSHLLQWEGDSHSLTTEDRILTC